MKRLVSKAYETQTHASSHEIAFHETSSRRKTSAGRDIEKRGAPTLPLSIGAADRDGSCLVSVSFIKRFSTLDPPLLTKTAKSLDERLAELDYRR